MSTQQQSGKENMMTRKGLWRLAALTMWLIATVPVAEAASEVAGTDPQVLSGDRVLLGTVEEIRSDQAKIKMSEGQPRFLPMHVRKDKGLPELKREIWSRSPSMIKICWLMCIKPVKPATIVWCEGNSQNRCPPATIRR